MKKIIAFDCDSTLSAIEGVDELARLAGPETFSLVEELTNQAMDGQVPVEEVFGRRLELIRPSLKQCLAIGDLYLREIEPTARETIKTLQDRGWECLILSGGFAPCIEPLARELAIEHVEAVPLFFAGNGDYQGFDVSYPTTRNGGKPEVIKKIKQSISPDRVVMVGDGVSDLETTPVVDRFIGFLRYARREKVASNCMHQAESLLEILEITKDL